MRTLVITALLLPAFPTLAALSPAPAFQHVDVDTQIEIGYGVAVADVNGDKRPDILLADKNFYVWYENPTWKKHVMAERLTRQDHVCLAAHDVDADGRCEVAVGAGWNPGDTLNSGAVFSLTAPADRSQRWPAVPLPHEPTVHRMRWVKSAGPGGRHDLIMVPLHGRGNKPATGDGDGVRILAYQRPSNAGGAWSTNVIETALHKTHNFDPAQWDADPEEELLIASKEGVFLVNVTGQQGQFTQLSGTESGGAGEVRAGRLGRNSRFFATVEPMHGTNLVVYLEPHQGGGPQWSRRVLDSTLVDGHALGCGDFSGRGSDQIVVGWRAMGKPGVRVGIKLFTPTDGSGTEWRQTLIDDNTMACEDLCLADLNGDGRLDIIAAGRATKNVKVYLNQAAPR